MVRVAGKPYHCSCGANVFSKLSSDTYRCNGCGATYEGKDAA
jgi:ribosomal protein L37AE/L43A